MKWLLRAVLVLAVAFLCAAFWLLETESGLRWALGYAPRELVVEGVHGALAREIAAERVAWEDIEARKVSFEVNLFALPAGTVSVNFLRIESLSIKLKKDDGKPQTLLPLRIKVADAQVKSLVVEGYEVNDLRLDYTGSALGHDVAASFRAAGARAKLDAKLNARAKPTQLSADVEALNLAVIDPDLPQTALRAHLEARGDDKSASGRLALENPGAGPLDQDRLPLASAAADFSTDFSSISLSNLKATLRGSGVLEGGARIAGQSARLDLRVRELDLRSLRSNLARTRLAGQLAIALEPKRQRVQGTLAQDDMSLSADAERSGDVIEVRALRARASGGEASGRGRLRLGKVIGFEADLKLARFDPSRFGDYPKGSLSGSVKGNGSLGATRQGSFAWDIAASTLLDQPFASSGRARLAGERIADGDAWATLGANRATAKGAFGGPRDEVAWTLSIPELKALHQSLGGEVRARGTAGGTFAKPRVVLSADARNLAVPGLAFYTVSVKAAGTLDAHEGDIKAHNADLDLTARLKGGWSGKRWSGEILALENSGPRPLALQAPSPLEIAAGRVALGRFNATLAGGRIAIESLRWEDGYLSSVGAFAALPAQSLLNFLGEKRLGGDLVLDGDWSLLSTPKLNGRLALRRSGGDLALAGPPQVPLELSRATLDARFTDGKVAAAFDLATRLGTARVEGEAAGLTRDSAASYTAEIELKELRLLTEPLWTQVRLSGRVGATLKGAGTLGRPVLTGTLRGDSLGVEAPPYGMALTGGRLRAELEGERLRIVEATIAGGEGRFSLSGSMPLRLAEGGTALEWRAENFRVLNRPDTRLVVSGKGSAAFDGKKLGLTGELRADTGHFEVRSNRLPELDDDVVVAGRGPSAREKRAPLPVDLDLRLDLGERLTLRAFGFDGGIAGQLRVVTDSAGALLAQGRLRAVRAHFRAYGQELEVDPGTLIFDGPLDRPAIDITAWRRHQQVEAGVHVTGSVDAPRVELVSNPPVADADKLSWLVLGRAPSTASGADLALLQAASGALIGMSSDQVPMQRRIASRLGLDEITVRGSSDLPARSATESTTNVFALGKRLSDKLYVSFEQALGSTAEYLVKLDYSLTQRVSVRGQTGTTSGVGLFYRYAWD
jgi:translocation and assembly module TamB